MFTRITHVTMMKIITAILCVYRLSPQGMKRLRRTLLASTCSALYTPMYLTGSGFRA